MKSKTAVLSFFTCLILIGGVCGSFAQAPYQALREKAQKQFKDSNYKDAYAVYRQYIYADDADPKLVVEDFKQSIECLGRLNRVAETDAVRKDMAQAHPDNWRVLEVVAHSWQSAQPYGYIVAGEFERGSHRGGGEYASCAKRDRVRALRLLQKALPLVENNAVPAEASEFYFNFADIVMGDQGHSEAWRLQNLTDLSELPEFEQRQRWWGLRPGRSSNIGAPVDSDGKPVFHYVPDSFETAQNDGERWRWLLWKAKEVNSAAEPKSKRLLADFLYNQFGVQTMANYGWFFHRPRQPDDASDDTSGTYELHTLGQNETIAQLATGIKRFTLPQEFDFIRYYTDLDAYDQLANIFQNRRQYPRAAEYWRSSIKENGRTDSRQQALDQILGNWGQFEPVTTQSAGKGATVDYKFRNGEQVKFTAHAVKVEALLEDVKAYIQSDPVRLDWREINIGNIGYRIVHENQEKYIGNEVANWTLDLDPARDHFDKRITVETPLKQAGAYLLTAEMADGNRSDIIIWVNDTAIVKRNMAATDDESKQATSDWYFVADAVTGAPVDGANVSFFGYWGERLDQRRGKRYQHIRTTQFAVHTDSEGQVVPDADDYIAGKHNPRYIVTARTDDGRFAFLGFTAAWTGRYHDRQYKQVKTYCISDRPVYRPGQTVKFKAWIRNAQYDMPNESRFAGQTFQVVIRNAKNEEIYKKSLKSDEYGGISDEITLPEDAALGQYRWSVDRINGGGHFRVEEYKKPEFEVQIEAPAKPVMLGEKITATVQADYYFGEPVKEAMVKIKVTRTKHDARWYPPRPWDWLYGEGYWWFAPDYDWYPGWGSWGIRCPTPIWWHRPAPEPEVVMEREVEIGSDGAVPVEIDTAVAKAMHGDSDHSYTITAEVTDKSRRTIVGKGEVLVARKPFKVYAWVDRGYYRVGDTVHARVSARTLDGTSVAGEGELRLLRISYDRDRQPVETEVQSWDLDTNDRGTADLQLNASRAGQYRLAYTLTDKAGHTIAGGYVFTIRGAGTDANDFRFNAIELVPDNPEYHPGDTVQLLVNTKQSDSTVVLFVRPANGVYLMPRILHLDGKSQIVPIEISKQDMPNFFVEAFTVSNGDVHKATREIVVPPEERVLNCEVLPSQDEYKPGEDATIKVKLTDLEGEPFLGSTVMTIYDRAVEYISGGSNLGGIKEFFWKWRRQHNPSGENNLNRRTGNLIGKDKTPMRSIGIFGHSVADEVTEETAFGKRDGVNRARGGGLRMQPMASKAVSRSGMALGEAAPMAMDADADVGGGGEGVEQPVVRTQFADTAYWNAELNTDNNGVAEVEFAMPENLTSWKIRLWAMGQETRVGEATTEVVTRKNLMLRMQAPRFFVQTDEVVLSANIHNYLDDTKLVTAKLELDGNCLELLEPAARIIEVEAGGEARVDWRVKVAEPGTAVVRMQALTDEESDAMQQEYEVYVHGMLRTESFSGAIRPEDASGSFTFTVPPERRPEQSRLEIRWSPSLAGAMVDALPYLADYPYGCTEQTLSRFLPAVLTRKVLQDMGIDLAEIKQKQTNLNAQEIGDDQERAKQWKRYDRNPVFDEQELDRMVKEGLKRLYNMQLSDGGWGWFSGYGERASAHTTAYVVHGLQIAEQSGLAIVPSALQDGLDWLERYQKEQVRQIKDEDQGKQHPDNRDAFVFMVLVDADIVNPEMRRLLYDDREHLAVYAKAMVGLAMDRLGRAAERDMLIRNIDQYLVQDDENQSAWLNLPNSGYWWHWYGSEYEAQAYYLKLLCRTQPKSSKAARLVKYLVNNRKHATYWKSTRDTAICVEAMAEYMRASGEVKPDMTVMVVIDGVERKQVRITPQDLFSFDNKLVLVGAELTSGKHTVELRKQGQGPLYFNAYQTNFTLEKYIERAGLEVKVRRKFYRLVEADKNIKVRDDRGQAVDQRVDRYEREPLGNLDRLASGDLVEVELVVESKNDYEYIVIEDRKPAGFEPVAVRSGYHSDGLRSYVEYRDEKVAFFVQRLARGKHSLSYRVRAEIPGKFSALPAKIEAMYAPELKGNSDEFKTVIGE